MTWSIVAIVISCSALVYSTIVYWRVKKIYREMERARLERLPFMAGRFGPS